MVYTPVGPFADNSATPPINAAFLNGVENTLVSVNQIPASQTIASGGTLVIPLPGYSAGLVLISASVSGGWFTGYVGAYVTGISGALITQLSLQNLPPASAIASVIASTTSLSLTVTMASSGSLGQINYVVTRATP